MKSNGRKAKVKEEKKNNCKPSTEREITANLMQIRLILGKGKGQG
jgi:hypothetical protein